jgi:type I restriction-modification system DNA methylase subunit
VNPSGTDAARIGIPDIAEIAGVTRTAVSNWRKRYEDFPEPAIETPSGVLFDLAEVERWLIEKGKIQARVPASKVLWQGLDALRAQIDTNELGHLVNAALVYLEVCDRATEGLPIPGLNGWDTLREVDPPELLPRLRADARAVEAELPELEGLVSQGFSFRREPRATAIRDTVNMLDRATTVEGTPRAAVFEEIRDRVHEVARFSGEHATPAAMENLLAKLTEGAGVVFDPACGEGGALLLSELMPDPGSYVRTLFGWELNVEVCSIARTRFFLYNVDAHIEAHDSLREPMTVSGVDVVILDPPYGRRDWANADDYVSGRWKFGVPPPKSSDAAWLQLAIEPLNEDGRAFVLLPAGFSTRGGREEHIRARMIEAGVVDAVVLLPPRLRRDVSIQLALWCLRSDRDPARDDQIMLADASLIGSPSRSVVSLDDHEIDSVVTLVKTWSTKREIDTGDQRIRAVALSGNELQADLDPRKYQAESAPDVAALRTARNAAYKRLVAVRRRADQALDDLTSSIEGSK